MLCFLGSFPYRPVVQFHLNHWTPHAFLPSVCTLGDVAFFLSGSPPFHMSSFSGSITCSCWFLPPRLYHGPKTEPPGCWNNLGDSGCNLCALLCLSCTQVLTPPSTEDVHASVWWRLAEHAGMQVSPDLRVPAPSSVQTPGCSSKESLLFFSFIHFLGPS